MCGYHQEFKNIVASQLYHFVFISCHHSMHVTLITCIIIVMQSITINMNITQTYPGSGVFKLGGRSIKMSGCPCLVGAVQLMAQGFPTQARS